MKKGYTKFNEKPTNVWLLVLDHREKQTDIVSTLDVFSRSLK